MINELMSDPWLQLGFSVFLSMQKHAIVNSKKATDFINSGQVPVIVGGCPLYVQWKKVSGSFPTRSVNQRWCASWASSTFRWHPNKVGGNFGWIWLGADALTDKSLHSWFCRIPWTVM